MQQYESPPIAMSVPTLRDPITTEDWLDEWLRGPGSRATGKVVRERRRLAAVAIIPSFGDKLITQVQPEDIKELLAGWQRCVSGNTLRQRFFVLNGLFEDARQARYIVSNPCTKVVPPPRISPPPFPWTSELFRRQVTMFLGSHSGDVGLLVIGGAFRPKELYAATCEDYCPSERSFFVRYPGRYVVQPRTVILPEFAAKAAARLVQAAGQKRTPFLWSLRDGRPCSENYFVVCMREAFGNGDALTLHAQHLRHAYAFLASCANVDHDVVEYYLKMRLGRPAPTMARIALSAEAVQRVYEDIMD